MQHALFTSAPLRHTTAATMAMLRRCSAGVHTSTTRVAPRRAFHSAPCARTAAAEASSGAPAASASASASSSGRLSGRSNAPRKQGRTVMIGLAAFISCGFLFPFWLHQHNAAAGHHYTASKPLNSAQIMRGAFLNSGSKDVGPDPAWHAAHGITRVEGDVVDAKNASK